MDPQNPQSTSAADGEEQAPVLPTMTFPTDGSTKWSWIIPQLSLAMRDKVREELAKDFILTPEEIEHINAYYFLMWPGEVYPLRAETISVVWLKLEGHPDIVRYWYTGTPPEGVRSKWRLNCETLDVQSEA